VLTRPALARESGAPNTMDVERFLRDGYLVTPVPATQAVLDDVRSTYESLIATAEALGSSGLVKTRKSNRVEASGRGWSWGCDHIHSPELRRQALLEIANMDPIPGLVTSILGPRIRFCGAHGHWSASTYDYYLHWHRDTRRERWGQGNPDTRAHVQVCVALVDEAVVWVVPGSHVRDLMLQEERFITTHPHAPHPEQVIVSVPAGHALLLNTYTLHRAQCERNCTRRSLHFGFGRVGADAEPGRAIKVWPWLTEPAFLAEQTPFLRNAILEQVDEAGGTRMDVR